MIERDRIQSRIMTIRPLVEKDRDAVNRILRRAFPLLQRWSLRLDHHVLVVEDSNGAIQGALKCKLIDKLSGSRIGLISWACADPGVQGRGLGPKLVNIAMDYFKQHHCREIIACIEGFNTPSSNMAVGWNGTILPLFTQIHLYGPYIFTLWYRLSHFLDFGHFMWRYPAIETHYRLGFSWWCNLIVNGVLAVIALRSFTLLSSLPFILLALFILFGIRHISMRAVAHFAKIPVIYRPWESAFLLGFGVALIPFLFLPLPGTLYPDKKIWRYRRFKKILTRMALLGVMTNMGILYILTMLKVFSMLPWEDALFWRYVIYLGRFLVFFDIGLPFFPFDGLNGKRILVWNKPIWIVLFLLSVLLFIM